MPIARHRRTAFLALLVLAGSCLMTVVAAVVRTGRDGKVTDWLALLAVAAIAGAWRLHRRPAD
ncbi:MAG TPA: hypothetical protein VHW64_00550 [Nocardioides sp.]|jgi:hypothetical protein|uniref:hypothetical protein n=1 Tax=Nocardioides sp. TaxID=35761 RepID=UPI002E2F21CE|nr:hypothetical protein [Nocardioides sp.]HEX3929163.1 hypothetical protein [Nocardioides sp.]